MKNRLLYIVVPIICIIAIISFYAGWITEKSNVENKHIVHYQEMGVILDSSYCMGRDLSDCPFPPHRYEKGIIPDASTAAQITYDYIVATYGEKCAKTEQPYQIKLINNKIWEIKGCIPMNELGGTFSIAIDRFTGKIYYILHEK